MFVLMRLRDRTPGLSPDEAYLEFFDAFKSAYEDDAADGEAYLSDPSEDPSAAAANFVDGALAPDEIRETASRWNGTVESTFDACLGQLRAQAPLNPDGSVHWLGAPSPAIYSFRKAAVALDGQFYDFADRILLVNEHRYPTAVFTERELAHAMACPEEYAMFDVWPK